MRILMVAPQPFLRPRGTPFSVFHRIRALLRLGHEVELVTYPFGESPELGGLTIHRSSRPPGVRDVRIGPSLAKVGLDVPLAVLAYRLAGSGRFDLVHTHEEAGVLGVVIRRRFGIPHLYDMHSSLPQQFANFRRYDWRPVVAVFRWLEGFTLRGADAVIAVCPELRDHVGRRGYRGPLAMIENTLDFDGPPVTPAEIEALRKSLGLIGRQLVVYTGTLETYQGTELLLAAATGVAERWPDVVFLIVGGTAEQIGRLESIAARNGSRNLFRFVPAVPPEQVARYHAAADVLVTTRSRGTNTPMKIYQYLRAGKPVVATRIPAHTQVLDPTIAELVQPESAAIAEGIHRVLAAPAHARALALNAERIARERYHEGEYFRRLQDLLHRIPAPARPAAVGIA